MSSPIRVPRATSAVHLDYNAGEDIEIELLVTDKLGEPVLLSDAVGTIALPGCAVQHTFTVAAGNLVLGDEPGVVTITATSAETTAWYAAFGDSEWQLDTTDIFGKRKRPCEGDVRGSASRAS